MSGIEVLFPGNDGSGVCLLRSARGSRERTQESELLQGLSPLTLGTEGLASATPLHSQQDLETGRDALLFPICPFSEKAMAPTPVLLPGKSHGRRSLVGCSPWGRTESDMTEAT